MNKKAVIIDGCRTPFLKSWTDFRDLSAVDLGKMAVSELIHRTNLEPSEIDEVIMGVVIPPVYAPNVAREIVLALGLPPNIPGYTINRACPSSVVAIINAAESIYCGGCDVVIAGGSESLSNIPIPHRQRTINTLLDVTKAKTFSAKLKGLWKIKLRDFIPQLPKIAEFSTGYSMGEHAEMMAKINGITRQAQDEFAYQSHVKAAAATTDGRLKQEIVPAYLPPAYKCIEEDNGIRKDASLEAMSKLNSIFDRRYGTVTAANSCPVTDGGAATLVMSEEKAISLGYTPKAYIRSYATAALDPFDQLLMGPSYAIPKALERAGLKLSDMDLIDMHEAFAAQVLSNILALESKKFAHEKLGQSEAVGEVDRSKLNVCGGSISIGHPFGATGARMVTTVINELERRNGQYALLSICAGGAIGVAMVLERK